MFFLLPSELHVSLMVSLRNEIPINCSFTQWKRTYILDFGPRRRSALNMGYMDKQPSILVKDYRYEGQD